MTSRSPPSTASLGFGIAGKPKKSKRREDKSETPAVRKAKILVVDDDPAVRRLLEGRLSATNYAVETADCAQAALNACVLSRPNLVMTDLRMPGMDGLALLKELKVRWPQIIVIILTGHGTIAEAVQATQRGAFSFLVKPVGKEELLGHVQRAIAASTFTATDGDWRSNILARNQLLEDRMALANRAADTDAPVLFTGGSGTGTELFARAIHAASARRDKPFVAVSCRDAAEHLLESTLFGSEIDKPIDAAAPLAGALGRARGGTLLLDEIGDMSAKLQVALAAALRKGSFPSSQRGHALSHDVRLICTTRRDLKPLLDTGEFRRELYYEINIFPMEAPPLGRRREDIPLLVSHFLEQATQPGSKEKIYTRESVERLATDDWPGDVRQLFDLVKQNLALSRADQEQIPSYDEARDKFTHDYLTANLQRTAGNVSQSARVAKRNRSDFYKLLARYRLQPEDFKKGGSVDENAAEIDDE